MGRREAYPHPTRDEPPEVAAMLIWTRRPPVCNVAKKTLSIRNACEQESYYVHVEDGDTQLVQERFLYLRVLRTCPRIWWAQLTQVWTPQIRPVVFFGIPQGAKVELQREFLGPDGVTKWY